VRDAASCGRKKVCGYEEGLVGHVRTATAALQEELPQSMTRKASGMN
jgi:hypothetical protein